MGGEAYSLLIGDFETVEGLEGGGLRIGTVYENKTYICGRPMSKQKTPSYIRSSSKGTGGRNLERTPLRKVEKRVAENSRGKIVNFKIRAHVAHRSSRKGEQIF